MNARHDFLYSGAGAGALPRYECLLCNEPATPTPDDIDACICGNLIVDPVSGHILAAAPDTVLDRDSTLTA